LVSFSGQCGRGERMTTHLKVVQGIKASIIIPLLPLYTFMEWKETISTAHIIRYLETEGRRGLRNHKLYNFRVSRNTLRVIQNPDVVCGLRET
jgi:hypothetical protein